MRPLVCIAALLVLTSAVRAQDVDVHETLRPLSYLVGQWEGPAWYMTPDGNRVDVIQTEDVFAGAGGHVLVVQGTGYLRQEDGSPGAAQFNALGVISFDPESGRHYVDAFNEGRHIRTEVVPTEDGFEWGFEAGGRTVRYVTRMEDDGNRWVETGHVLVGPDRWVPFVELNVSRVGH
jgi:hypothetical protein